MTTVDNYEPTAERKIAINQAKLRGLYEQRYSLEVDARVNARLDDAESVAQIKKDLGKIEKAIDLMKAELDTLQGISAALDAPPATNGHRKGREVQPA